MTRTFVVVTLTLCMSCSIDFEQYFTADGAVDAGSDDAGRSDAAPPDGAPPDALPPSDAGPDAGSDAGSCECDCASDVCVAGACQPAQRASGVTVGGAHVCAWTEAGVLYCWGDNSNGQLGIVDPPMSGRVPGEVTLAAVATTSAGNEHTCAVTSTGSSTAGV